MPKTIRNNDSKRAFRTKAGVIAAGLGASLTLGAGVSMAADAGVQDLFASGTAAQLADSTRGQADQLSKGEAKKQVAERNADKPSRGGERKANAWTKPVDIKYELTGDYGNSGDRWANKHSGQDFAVPTGTDVKAVHDGTVVKAGGNGAGDGASYGNAVVIKHYDGSYTQYAHLSSIDVQPGEQVKGDQKIADSGSTGNSSGPHLHFEVRTAPDYGTAVDPVQAMEKGGVKL